MRRYNGFRAAAVGLFALCCVGGAMGQPGQGGEKKPDFPPFKDVSEGYEKVISTADGSGSLYDVYFNAKDQELLAELPRGFERQRHYFAGTVASGDTWAGLQGGTRYVYWKRYGKRLALIEPNIDTRSTGDQESQDAVSRQFTDRVILDVPIVCMGPSGQPVIDLDQLLVGNLGMFFGRQGGGANARLATFTNVKAFPENIEVAVELPVAGGVIKEFHYSISEMKENPHYKPRKADQRVGFFTTSYRDLGVSDSRDKWVRYANRWHIEKADPKLKISPPKEPLVYYIEHTTPVRYRRWVRDGVLAWNRAYEQVGIRDAIEVRYQDKATGSHMDKDPEDVRYNFIRWISNDISTAIGPSRVHPRTGEIKDADVVLTDGWIRVFWYEWKRLMPEMALEGMGPETLAWLERNPNWDPRVRLAPAAERDSILAERAARGVLPGGGHPLAMTDPTFFGDDEFDGLASSSQFNACCAAAQGLAWDVATMRMHLQILGMLDDEDDEGEGDTPKKEDEGDLLDGIPDWYIGPALRDLVMHEVGHTLGLRHNFKASSIYSMEQINSDEVAGVKPFAASVMDYNPTNINMNPENIQGDYTMRDVGPYDMWAIRWGYEPDEKKLPDILKENTRPEHVYLTDEDTWGPDPLARRYDFGADPINYAKEQVALATYHRERLLDKFVKDGEDWSNARSGYNMALSQQMRAVSMMANWLGGSYVSRAHKGDPDAPEPTRPVEADLQRGALAFCIEQMFYDDAFGLTPELLRHMTVEKWFDEGGISQIADDPTWDVHDRILSLQASTLTMLLNPTTLRRVLDNEMRTDEGQDMVTLAEVMETITSAAWSELDSAPKAKGSAREPTISSLRRNLQREHLDRLIDLTMPNGYGGAAAMPIANLATMHLNQLRDKMTGLTEGKDAGKLDPYSLAHLSDCATRIGRALDATYIYNTDDIGGGGGGFFFRTPAAPAGQ